MAEFFVFVLGSRHLLKNIDRFVYHESVATGDWLQFALELESDMVTSKWLGASFRKSDGGLK